MGKRNREVGDQFHKMLSSLKPSTELGKISALLGSSTHPDVSQNFSHILTYFDSSLPSVFRFSDLKRGATQGAKTKHHRLGVLSNRSLFSPSSGGWKSKNKVRVGLVFVRALSPACRWHLPTCVLTRPFSVYSVSFKGTDPIRLGPHPYNLI